ncbi:hypothetical protein ACFPFV_06380 [Salinicoccus siamensis]
MGHADRLYNQLNGDIGTSGLGLSHPGLAFLSKLRTSIVGGAKL